MKRLPLFFLIVLLLLSPCASAAPGDGLVLNINAISFQPEWNDEISDTHVYLVLDASLTNWHTETYVLSEAIRAELSYLDTYSFEAFPAFAHDEIEPLVMMDGALVFRLPAMLAQLDPKELSLTIVSNGKPESISLEALPSASIRAGSFEGPGYATPEDALLAYIEAMQRGDLNAALSTFAIETLAKNTSAKAMLERLRAFTISAPTTMPVVDDYGLQLLTSQRYAELSSALYRQYLSLNWNEDWGDLFTAISFPSGEELDAFLSDFSAALESSPLQKMEFIEFLYPDDFSKDEPSVYYSETNQKSIARQIAPYGAEEACNLAAHILLDGEDYIQFMQCIRYGDRWYNHTLSGNLSIILGLSVETGGLAPLSYLES